MYGKYLKEYILTILNTQTAKYDQTDSDITIKILNSVFKTSAYYSGISIATSELNLFLVRNLIKEYIQDNDYDNLQITNPFIKKYFDIISQLLNINLNDIWSLKYFYNTALWYHDFTNKNNTVERFLKYSLDWYFYLLNNIILIDGHILFDGLLRRDNNIINIYRSRYVLGKGIIEGIFTGIRKFMENYHNNVNSESYIKALKTFIVQNSIIFILEQLIFDINNITTPVTNYTTFINNFLNNLQTVLFFNVYTECNNISDVELDPYIEDPNNETSVEIKKYLDNISQDYVPRCYIYSLNRILNRAGTTLITYNLINTRFIFEPQDVFNALTALINYIHTELKNINFITYEIEHDSKFGTLDIRSLLKIAMSNTLVKVIELTFSIYYSNNKLTREINDLIVEVADEISSFFDSITFDPTINLEDLVEKFYTKLFTIRQYIGNASTNSLRIIFQKLANKLDPSIQNQFLNTIIQVVKDVIANDEISGFIQNLFTDFIINVTELYYNYLDDLFKVNLIFDYTSYFINYKLCFIQNSLTQNEESNLPLFIKQLIPIYKLNNNDIYKSLFSQHTYYQMWDLYSYLNYDLINAEDRLFYQIIKPWSIDTEIKFRNKRELYFFNKINDINTDAFIEYDVFDKLTVNYNWNTLQIKHNNFALTHILSRLIINTSRHCIVENFSGDNKYLTVEPFIDLLPKQVILENEINNFLQTTEINIVYYNNLLVNSFNGITTNDEKYIAYYIYQTLKQSIQLDLFYEINIFYLYTFFYNVQSFDRSYYDATLYDIKRVLTFNNWTIFIKNLQKLTFDITSQLRSNENNITNYIESLYSKEQNLPYHIYLLLPVENDLCYILS